ATQPGVKCVVLVGHSEGALLAAMAAHTAKTCGVVSLAGAGRPAREVLRSQLTAQSVPPALLAQLDEDLTKLSAGQRVTDVPPAFATLLRPSVQPYLISWLHVDPAAELAHVTVPVLIVQGDHDLQVGVEDAQRLAK